MVIMVAMIIGGRHDDSGHGDHDGHGGHVGHHGDFPGNLCKAAFAYLAIFDYILPDTQPQCATDNLLLSYSPIISVAANWLKCS